MEALLKFSLRKDVDFFKEDLRELGGLDKIIDAGIKSWLCSVMYFKMPTDEPCILFGICHLNSIHTSL